MVICEPRTPLDYSSGYQQRDVDTHDYHPPPLGKINCTGIMGVAAPENVLACFIIMIFSSTYVDWSREGSLIKMEDPDRLIMLIIIICLQNITILTAWVFNQIEGLEAKLIFKTITLI